MSSTLKSKTVKIIILVFAVQFIFILSIIAWFSYVVFSPYEKSALELLRNDSELISMVGEIKSVSTHNDSDIICKEEGDFYVCKVKAEKRTFYVEVKAVRENDELIAIDYVLIDSPKNRIQKWSE